MRPGFLIIGAMKAGTTTLYRDLLTNPAVFMPADKEPENLCHDAVLTDAGRREYDKLFAAAPPGRLCGEASTAYTKLPDHPGVPTRARKLLGPDLKVIYLVRDPIARIVSHHHHDFAQGLAPSDINAAVREDRRFIDYTRYAMQAEPWIDAFGPANVRILRFEVFTRDRVGAITSLCEFLGIPPRPDLIDPTKVYNQSEGKPVATGFWSSLSHTSFYRTAVRPWLSPTVKDRIRHWLLPKAPPRPAPPSEATRAWILDTLADDQARLDALLRAQAPEPAAAAS